MPKQLPAFSAAHSRRDGSPLSLVALCSLAAVLLAASPTLGAPPPEETRIVVDALVLDRDGNPVRGLNRGDFEVIIGERVRPVSDARMVEAEIAPRRFVFVVNRRGALPAQLRRMKGGLADFVSSRFSNHDEALFVDFAEVPRITRGWRTGRAETLLEVRSVTAMGFQSPLGPAEDAADTAFMLQALAERLRELPGRKVVVLFSGSLSTFVGTPGGDLEPVAPWGWADLPSARPGSEDALGALGRAFNAANASIYAVHLEGARRQEEGILQASRDEYSGPARNYGGSRGTTALRVRNSSASLSGRRMAAFDRPTDDFLSSLASETGGNYTAQATDFARVLEDIEYSNRLWYEISFPSFGSNIPGRYQPHEIRVRRIPGLRVVVRPGHVVPE
ncbi:MAG: VWA domain-containing protein [Acidobacteriota bacterium]|nr:VWA domain-containing protein [Acidobacteriota bacterium]